MRNLTIKIIASLALAATATAARAHAQLQKAVPAVGGTVTASPKEIRLKFSEGLEARFSGITLTTQTGEAVAIGKPTIDAADASAFVAPISQPLKPGVYTVTWHTVSVDTHKTQGSFNFTVSP